jgi:N-acetylmuramoyl-L-alanine amidase
MSEEAPWDSGAEARDPVARQVIRNLTIAVSVAAVLATVFTAWVPASLNPGEVVANLLSAAEPAAPTVAAAVQNTASLAERSLRVGIVAGHSGPHRQTGYEDPGAECPDGLTELQVNQSVAELLVDILEADGLQVDLLEEFDPRLEEYQAVALVSIHADQCLPINEQATGFKIAAAMESQVPDRSQRLVTCIADRYRQETDLAFHPDSITRDMTEYHTFYEIDNLTPAVIIETGYLYLDREILTKEPDRIAKGIAEGIMCYVNNESATLPAGGSQ